MSAAGDRRALLDALRREASYAYDQYLYALWLEDREAIVDTAFHSRCADARLAAARENAVGTPSADGDGDDEERDEARRERDALRRLYAQARRAIVAVRSEADAALGSIDLCTIGQRALDRLRGEVLAVADRELGALDIEEGVARVERRGEWEGAP